MSKKLRKDTYQGILFIILSAFCFALMNAFVHLSGELPSTQKSFFRNLVAFFFAFFILLKNKERFHVPAGNYKLLLARSVFGTIGILCNYYAVDHLILSDASMLNKMSPFFTILFSLLILKEALSFPQATAVLLAFIGSLFIIKPSFFNLEFFPASIGFLGGMCAGLAYTFVRLLGTRGVNGPFIVFFFSAFSCLILLPVLLFHFVPMTLQQLMYLILAGFSAAGGQFFITAAYCHAPAREISVYDYSQILFSASLGFFLFGQLPDGYSVLGYFIICSAAIWMFFYNKKKSQE